MSKQEPDWGRTEDRLQNTREGWLTQAMCDMSAWFDEIGKKFPSNVAVTCGWPSVSALAGKNRRIGEAWTSEASKRKVFELFISPYLDDAIEVLATLLHEMIHACAGLRCGHRGEFKRQAIELGLRAPMRSTTPGEQLTKRLNALAKMLGTYPHRSLDTMTNARVKQTTRLLKASCHCGYTVRITKKWANFALPECPLCNTVMQLEDTEDN